MKTSKRYPKVKATNGAVFELRRATMKQTIPPCEFADVYSVQWWATASQIRTAMETGWITMQQAGDPRFAAYGTDNKGPRSIGCMHFTKAGMAKIRQWAKGAKHGK